MEATQIPAGDRMAPVATEINRNYARFCELLIEADQAQEWRADGSPDVTQWLDARFGIQPKMGRRLSTIARRLEDLPELRKRFAAGELTLDVVDLLSEVATPDTELGLIEQADGRDLHDISRIASCEKPPTREQSARDRDSDWMSIQWDLHRRRMRYRGELTGAEAQLVEDRLVAHAKDMPRNLETGEYEDWSKRMAHALVEVCATDSDGSAPIPTMVLHADVSVFEGETRIDVAELARGPVISRELAEMIGCDASIETAIHEDGTPIGIGRKSRKIPGWLRRQVEYRDHHCQAPGCGRTIFLQIHHLQPWSENGRSDLDNLVLLCWWHHIFIHENGWYITRDPRGRFVFRKPDWTPYPPRPI